jgi:hypothetical protein
MSFGIQALSTLTTSVQIVGMAEIASNCKDDIGYEQYISYII